ncbi:MAG: putative glycoside hydrolase [Desertimonas sp.]
MIRDDVRPRGAARPGDRRVIYRPPQSNYQVRPSLDIRPRRRRHRRRPSARFLAVALLVVAAGGALLMRTLAERDLRAATITPTDASDALLGPDTLVVKAISPSTPGHVSTLRGIADGATELRANGEPIALQPGGLFRIHLPQGLTALQLTATDAAGNAQVTEVAVSAQPVTSTYPPTVAVHVRAQDWANPAIRDVVVRLAREGRINAVQLDIKDEDGLVGYDSDVPLADEIGATATPWYDPREALAELHGLGVRVIGRIVCFLDPVLSEWAWESGRAELVVLDGDAGAPLANDYGTAAFSNFAAPEVRQYQIDLAIEAAELGFDDILYDYVRRPEGELDEMTFSGLDVPPEVAVATFVADTHAVLAPLAIEFGVSVFGISASRPYPTAQDLELLSPVVDYVAPMVYPSHWRSGEYGVADPNNQPYEIVRASLADFQQQMAGSGAAMVPWLQDFDSAGRVYGDAEVRAQIQAAYETGGVGFLLWNSSSNYSVEALDPLAGS